jgi:hypothetical protein
MASPDSMIGPEQMGKLNPRHFEIAPETTNG